MTWFKSYYSTFIKCTKQIFIPLLSLVEFNKNNNKTKTKTTHSINSTCCNAICSLLKNPPITQLHKALGIITHCTLVQKSIKEEAPLALEGDLFSAVIPSSVDAVVAVVVVDSNTEESRSVALGDLSGPPEPFATSTSSWESWVNIKLCVNWHRHAAEQFCRI